MDHFPMMARFNRWVNGRIYDTVAKLPDEHYRRDVGLFFGSIHATLNHLLLVDLLWTRRLRGELDDAFVAQVDAMTPADLDRPVVYTAILGKGQEEVRARHILATLNNHQTHHRGQVSAALTQAGIEPPALDVVFFLEEIGEAGAPGTLSARH